jgi:hypothetical protein
MIANHLGMHQAGVSLNLLLLMLLLDLQLVMRLLCKQCAARRQHNGRRDDDFDVFSHLVWLQGKRLACRSHEHMATEAVALQTARDRTALRGVRRSVSEKALLQDQFSERECARRPRIE